ncbi:MAG: hypothetical protein KatS3mg076_2756 [Candidatus Binatia bacterium]|nr:MAG: hypothetical protein KatS3mg076_2756 [Candidatus Binatia bacterium]
MKLSRALLPLRLLFFAAVFFPLVVPLRDGRAEVPSTLQGRCLRSLYRDFLRSAVRERREFRRCTREAITGKIETPAQLQECLGADEKGRMARLLEKSLERDRLRCRPLRWTLFPPGAPPLEVGGERPAFGYTNAWNVVEAGRGAVLGLLREILGDDPAGAFDASGAGSCQRKTLSTAASLLLTEIRTFRACVVKGLRTKTLDSREALAACLDAVSQDEKGTIARRASELGREIDRHCEGADLATVFPGACAGAPDFSACARERATCQVCRAVARAADVEPDCDAFDNGVADGSCDGRYPETFDTMSRLPATGVRYYVGGPCASNSNDGKSPTCDGSGAGPWADFLPLQAVSLSPGDTVLVRAGVYDLSAMGLATLELSSSGTPTEPIRLSAFPGETPVLDGGKSLDDRDPVVRLTGAYTIFEGFEVRGCGKICVALYEGADHVLFRDNRVVGSVEDGLKPLHAKNILILGNRFTGFAHEAIDVWGSHDVWIVGNEFFGNDTSFSPSSTTWAKAGSSHVLYVENDFHDLLVAGHALLLGGCCWMNWDQEGGLLQDEDGQWTPQPVARQVRALRNTFTAVEIDFSKGQLLPSVIGAQGCRHCEASGNVLDGTWDAFSAKPSASDTQPCFAGDPCQGAECTCSWSVAPDDVTFTGNTARNVVPTDPAGTGTSRSRFFSLWDGYGGAQLAIDGNTYCADGPEEFVAGSWSGGFAGWQALGFDLRSSFSSCAAPPGQLADFRLVLQGEYVPSEDAAQLESLCVTNRAWAANSLWLLCSNAALGDENSTERELIEAFIATGDEEEDEAALGQRLDTSIQLASTRGFDPNTTDFVLLNCEEPVHPRKWGAILNQQYPDLEAAYYAALARRIRVARSRLPNALLALGPTIRADPDGVLDEQLEVRMTGYRNAGAAGVYDELDCLEPRVYLEEDTSGGYATTRAMTTLALELSSTLTKTTGETLPLCVLSSVRLGGNSSVAPAAQALAQIDAVREFASQAANVLFLGWWDGAFDAGVHPGFFSALDLCDGSG